MEKFYLPQHATERLLGDGRPMTPGSFVTLTKEDLKDPHNKRLIEEGKLMLAVTGKDDGK